jgi:dihydroorotase/N-acyl-D-amino-acid deacylase
MSPDKRHRRKAGISVGAHSNDTVLLTGAQLADGTGQALRTADLLVENGHITAVEPPAVVPPDRHPTLDLTGLVLAPGFIDVHSHADNAPLLAEDDTTKILQGITTEVVGNCGFSLTPSSDDHAHTLSSFLRRLFPPLTLRWSGFHDLLARTDDAGYVTNYCPLVGHGTLRIAALGMANRAPDDDALDTMRSHLEEGMNAGAFGLSSGLIYPPAVFSTTDELLALADVLADDGLYTTHMRDEGDALLDAIAEALRIGKTAGRTHISHLKASGPANWGKLTQALADLDTARDKGQHVAQDVYPYTASSTMLTAKLPPEFLAGDDDTILSRLTSRAGRATLAEHFPTGHDWNRVLIATTASHHHEGRTIAEIAGERRANPVDILIEILVSERLRASMIHFTMHEDDLQLALTHEHTMIGTDGLPPGTGGKPHPRLYGTFPRVLGRYARDLNTLTFPEAIRRMTSLPAEQFRIPRRGRIAPGYVADIVAFDRATVTDVGDYHDPIHPPKGIPFVWQAGTLVVNNSTYVGGRHGQRLTPAS